MSLPDRFWSKVNKTDSCWLWTAGLTAGYGAYWNEGQMRRAHRLAWQDAKGPIPEGLELDHLCRVRNCVNPAHLEPVTSRLNTMRSPVAISALNALKTHCRRGHPYSGDNLHISPVGARECRACWPIYKARSKARREQVTS